MREYSIDLVCIWDIRQIINWVTRIKWTLRARTSLNFNEWDQSSANVWDQSHFCAQCNEQVLTLWPV